MKKMINTFLLMSMLVAAAANAAVLYDDFETYYTPGALRPSGADTHADPSLWDAGGSDCWNYQTNNGPDDDQLVTNVGNQTYRAANFISIQSDLSFNNAQGQTYSVDVDSYYQGSIYQAQNFFGIMSANSSWYGVDYAFAVRFSNSFVSILRRNSTSYNGWSGTSLFGSNYSGTITGIEIILDDTNYEVIIDGGIGLYNTGGSLSGQHGFSAADLAQFDNATHIYLAGHQGSPSVGPGLKTYWDNVSSAPVPEPTAAIIMLIGGIALHRRKRPC